MTDINAENFQIPYAKENIIYIEHPVTNFERAKDFYINILKFELKWDGGEEVGWCEFELPAPSTKLGLNLQRDPSQIRPQASLNFNITDLEATKSYLESKGVKTEDIVDLPDMISHFKMFDPDGNMITFISTPRVKTNPES